MPGFGRDGHHVVMLDTKNGIRFGHGGHDMLVTKSGIRFGHDGRDIT